MMKFDGRKFPKRLPSSQFPPLHFHFTGRLETTIDNRSQSGDNPKRPPGKVSYTYKKSIRARNERGLVRY